MSFISYLFYQSRNRERKISVFENGKIEDCSWRKSQLVTSRQVVTNQCCGLAVSFCVFTGKTVKPVWPRSSGTNSSPSKKRFSNRPIRFPGSNLDSGEITGYVIGSARSQDLTAWARGLSPTSINRSEAPRRWRARRPLASRVRNSPRGEPFSTRTQSLTHVSDVIAASLATVTPFLSYFFCKKNTS